MTDPQIISIDLFTLIFPVVQGHFSKYGNNDETYSLKKMQALLDCRPHEILQNDRTCREIVRAMLRANGCVSIGGNDTRRNYGVVFPTIPDSELKERILELEKDGLVGSVQTQQRPAPISHYFQSECIYLPKSNIRFYRNDHLRRGLFRMLEPFHFEEPQYVLDPSLRRTC
jgi:hypothetical protein